MGVGDAQPLQVCISPGDQTCICFIGARLAKNHLQQKLKMRTGHPWRRARGTHRSSRSQVGQGDGVPSFGAGPLSLSFSRTASGATDQSSLETEDKTSTLDAASKPTHSIAPGETKAAGFHTHKPDSSLLAGPLKTHHRHRKPLPPQEKWQRSPEYELYRDARQERSSSVVLGFASRSEEVNFCSLRAALNYVLTIYRCFAHLICSTIHKNMQLP